MTSGVKRPRKKDLEIRSLGQTSFDAIYKAFSLAFADYELQLNAQQLQTMLKRRGFDPDLSFAAFEGNEINAFTLNGTGLYNGVPTAYDTGTGTVPAYRGQGLATEIFEYSIPYLRENGIRQYLLEVLQHNTSAASVYRKLGFEVSREFNYFRQDMQAIRNETAETGNSFTVKQINIEEFSCLAEFWDFSPSWQNSFESVQRAFSDFVSLGAFAGRNLAGYCIFEPVSGDITQIAVDKNHRRKGIASILLKEMIRLNRTAIIKVINTEISCSSITGFLNSKNIGVAGRQFEMMRKIVKSEE
jgi:ribosomal protein S18 acetylase RimI-like enzyme